jgi:hypothetical protein
MRLDKKTKVGIWTAGFLGAFLSIAQLLVGSNLAESRVIGLGALGAFCLLVVTWMSGWISNAPFDIGRPVRALVALIFYCAIMAYLCRLAWPRVTVSPEAMSFFKSAMAGQTYPLTVTNGKQYDAYAVLVHLRFDSDQPEFLIDVPKGSCKPLSSLLNENSINDCMGLSCSNEPYAFYVYFYRLAPGEKREITVIHSRNADAHGSANIRYFSATVVPSNASSQGPLNGFSVPFNLGGDGIRDCTSPRWVFMGGLPGQLVAPPQITPFNPLS